MGPGAADGVEIHVAQAGMRVGNYRLVHLVAYHDTPTAAGLRLSERYHRVLRDRFPERTAIMSWIAPGLKMPDREIRALGAELFKGVAREIRCAATVIVGEGFWASAARSVLTGIQLLSRSPCPNRAFAETDEAAAWIVGHLDAGAEVDSGGLVRAMEELRSADAAGTGMGTATG